MELTRRDFLKVAGAVGTGIIISPSKVFGETASNSKPIIYLTIDDCPRRAMPSILEKLGEDHQATFFCVGMYLKDETKFNLALEAINRGHSIGNHSYFHPNFNVKSIENAKREIERTHDLIEKLYNIAGKQNPKLFRFPYGNTGGRKKKAIASILLELGYSNYDWLPPTSYTAWQDTPAYGWDILTNDCYHYIKGSRRVSEASVLRRLDKTKDQDVVLLHDFPIVLKVIERYLEKGFKLQALPQKR